jgi:hypothetical protein
MANSRVASIKCHVKRNPLADDAVLALDAVVDLLTIPSRIYRMFQDLNSIREPL